MVIDGVRSSYKIVRRAREIHIEIPKVASVFPRATYSDVANACCSDEFDVSTAPTNPRAGDKESSSDPSIPRIGGMVLGFLSIYANIKYRIITKNIAKSCVDRTSRRPKQVDILPRIMWYDDEDEMYAGMWSLRV